MYKAIVGCIVILDAFLKSKAEKKLRRGEDRPAAGGRILLTKYHNRGAALNFGQKNPQLIKWISVVFTMFVSMVFVLTLTRKGNRLLKLGLALMLGGAFSNTYDRLSKGYVVDYFRIACPIKCVQNVIFNISDFCIIIGSLMTVIS